MRNHVRLALASLGIALLGTAYIRSSATSLMTATARAFLNSLAAEQKAKATFGFEGDERLFWHFIPTADIPKRYNRPRRGLTLAEMTPAQKHLALALMAAGLSQSGWIKAATIMSQEDILRVMENDTAGRRNPELYHFSVFGQPSDNEVWGFRVEGHHISLHFTVVKGKVAGSPSFFGANPHEVRQGPRQGLRVLAAEEDLARALVESLDAAQKKAAVVAEKAYPDILTEASRKAALSGQPSGLPASKLNPKQRAMLAQLVEEYAANMPEEIARERREKLKRAGLNLHFAWAGPTGRGEPHYYRVVAPSFLIEYDNTQNNANHSHTVWREFDGDFGLDLLADHYRSGHRTQ